MARAWLAVCLALACAGCADDVAPLDARIKQWKQRADKAYAARNWHDAQKAYRNLYALLDPTPGRADVRATIAFRLGRAWGQQARHQEPGPRFQNQVHYAGLWLREAHALQPEMYAVWFERAQVLELQRAEDTKRAHAYRKFLEGYEQHAAGGAPSPEVRKRVELARTRLRELTDAAPDK